MSRRRVETSIKLYARGIQTDEVIVEKKEINRCWKAEKKVFLLNWGTGDLKKGKYSGRKMEISVGNGKIKRKGISQDTVRRGRQD